ncbi:glucose-6-phosphate isomerase [Metamycoplasma auris]|uniref:Glucose-6-phosphate isomerase n=1 Tax=Metamycoplasma auris TaxID=51363 RepID=A0A2W7G4H1_9BACT|nr:glucose-6-phosphate isomerase [Metamycoplasma auris]PZV99960.1 glucose-6-phosphate isomerase [Metamycoplasma auris]
MIKSRIEFNCDKTVTKKAFEKYKEFVNSINQKIKSSRLNGQNNLNFLNIKKNYQNKDLDKILKIRKFFEEDKIEVLVVIAPEYICMQSQSLIDLFLPIELKNRSSIEIIYVNESYIGIDIARLIRYLETKRFAINIISKNGDDLESLIIFRELISLLNNNIGKNNASKYIYVTTNNNYGRLFNWAKAKKYTQLVLLDNIPERFLNYSPAVLLPLVAANINLEDYLEGASEANNFYESISLENNAAYKYGLVRYLFTKIDLNKGYKDIFTNENILVSSKSHKQLGNLLVMYLNATSYKKYRGIRANLYIEPSETKIATNIFLDRQQQMFDTHLSIKNLPLDFNVSIMDDSDLNDLGYLMKYSYNKIGSFVNDVVIDYHWAINIPYVEIAIEDLSARSLGWIISFMHHASLMSAYLMEIDPFEDSGLKGYNIELTKKFTKIMGENKDE